MNSGLESWWITAVVTLVVYNDDPWWPLIHCKQLRQLEIYIVQVINKKIKLKKGHWKTEKINTDYNIYNLGSGRGLVVKVLDSGV